MKRRSFLRFGAAAAIAAPAIVERLSIMAIRPFPFIDTVGGLQLLMREQARIDAMLREQWHFPDIAERWLIVPPSWGIDLAKPGGDRSAVALRQGNIVRHVWP